MPLVGAGGFAAWAPCGLALDVFVDHAVLCMHNGFSVHHRKLQVTFSSIVQDDGILYCFEAEGVSFEKPADILITYWQECRPFAIGFSVVHRAPPSAYLVSVYLCSETVSRAEEAKVVKHTPTCNTMCRAFRPLGLSTRSSCDLVSKLFIQQLPPAS